MKALARACRKRDRREAMVCMLKGSALKGCSPQPQLIAAKRSPCTDTFQSASILGQ